MRRVMIIGQPGSGKSTLARKLGERTNLPVFHIDKIHYEPGWVERSNDEKSKMCLEVHALDKWIFEGGHSTTWPDRLNRCDIIIWLDYSFWPRLWRVVKRTLKDYGQNRVDLPENCPERFDLDFYKFIWKTRKTTRNFISTFFEAAPVDKNRIKLSTDSDVKHFLENL